MDHCNPPSPRKPPQYDQQLQFATASITPDNVANPVEDCGYNDDHESEKKEIASDNAFHVEENEYSAEVDEEDGYHEEQVDATAESDLRGALHLSITRCDQQRQAEKDEEPAASSNSTWSVAAKVDDGDDDDGNKKITSKLRIKVRGPKSEALEEAEYVEGGSPAASVEKHNCELCNRPFSSSKALGGHKRIHMAKKIVCSSKSFFSLDDDDDDDRRQTKKQIASIKYRGKNHNDGNIQADVRDNYVKNGIPTCYLCNKSFDTDKSLFGHMRCHPERQWRGMIPPPSFTTASSNPNNTSNSPKASAKNSADVDNYNMVSVSDQQEEAVAVAVDLLQSIPGWPLTGKRGQGQGRPSDTTSIPSYSASYSNTDHDFSIIARNLASLADHHNSQLNTLYQAAIAVELQISNDEHEEKGNHDDDSDTDSDDGDNDDDANSTLGKKEQDATPSSNTSLKYTCTTCHRSFHSHQALGGHRSSNHKPLRMQDNKNNGNKAAEEEEELEEGEIREEAEMQTAETNTSNHLHRCKVCDECFPSGQALGGHQRRHWNGPTVENRVDNPRGTQQFVCPIDLNVPPQDDADYAS